MLRLNKKLWSFIVGCLISRSFFEVVNNRYSIPIPNFAVSLSWFDFTLYYVLVLVLFSLIITGLLIMIMHYVMRIHSADYTFWLILPILFFLIFITVFANFLILAMLNVAIPSLILILIVARKKKKRRIFYEKKR